MAKKQMGLGRGLDELFGSVEPEESVAPSELDINLIEPSREQPRKSFPEEELVALMDEEGLAPCNDETLAMLSATTTTNAAWGETDADLPNYLVYQFTYPSDLGFETVGVIASGEYELTIVLDKSLAGFDLLYNLSGVATQLVKVDLYDACMTSEVVDGVEVFTSTYNTSLETTASFGPYKMSDYQTDKSMHFVRNDNWFGYTDGKHIYKDPEDGNVYNMYQTTEEMWFPNFDNGGLHEAVIDPRVGTPEAPVGPAGDGVTFGGIKQGGSPWSNDPKAVRHYRLSPHKLVTNWHTPLMVIHGGMDYRVPVDEGMAAYNAAQMMGVPSRLLIFPDENHWILKPQNALLWHREYFRWLDEWCR